MLREGEALPGGSYRVCSRRVHWRSQRKNLRLQQHDEDVTPPSNTCRNQLHSASAGTPAPNEERHMPKRGRRRSRGVFEPLRRGLRNRSFPLEPAITTNFRRKSVRFVSSLTPSFQRFLSRSVSTILEEFQGSWDGLHDREFVVEAVSCCLFIPD